MTTPIGKKLSLGPSTQPGKGKSRTLPKLPPGAAALGGQFSVNTPSVDAYLRIAGDQERDQERVSDVTTGASESAVAILPACCCTIDAVGAEEVETEECEQPASSAGSCQTTKPALVPELST